MACPMRKKDIKLAIVDNSIDSAVYTPVDHWRPYLDVNWEEFRAKEGLFPDLKKGYTHLILTGSEASIVERDNWVETEVEFVHKALQKEGISILGSCFGHQLLALALAGPSHVRQCPQPEIGWIPISIDKDNLIFGNRGQIFVFSSHFDEVVDLGSEFFVFSSTKKCPIQGFQLKNRPVWGIQSHPEISISEGKVLLKNFICQNPKRDPFFEAASRSNSQDSGIIHIVMKNFLK